MASEQQAPSLVDSLDAYIESLDEDRRADALHQVFYGFHTRVAIIDRSTYELARWAREDAAQIDAVPDSQLEALRDNALFVGQELFASRVRAMSAMGYVSTRLRELLDGEPAPAFTLTHALAFDQESGTMRSYELTAPGEHPDLPYDPLAYDPA